MVSSNHSYLIISEKIRQISRTCHEKIVELESDGERIVVEAFVKVPMNLEKREDQGKNCDHHC